uniref:Uncharacterized protein n=1 Tax=Schistosoma curassoni TaxID=6186 RepID=A0A183KQT0_9TREM
MMKIMAVVMKVPVMMMMMTMMIIISLVLYYMFHLTLQINNSLVYLTKYQFHRIYAMIINNVLNHIDDNLKNLMNNSLCDCFQNLYNVTLVVVVLVLFVL